MKEYFNQLFTNHWSISKLELFETDPATHKKYYFDFFNTKNTI
jgi:hypothetical protein